MLTSPRFFNSSSPTSHPHFIPRFLYLFMAELKTKKTTASVSEFLNSVEPAEKRADSQEIVRMMSKATKAEPAMWGPAIIGFGHKVLKYDSGRELDWFIMGFSPRKANIALYLPGGAEGNKDILAKLGKHKTGKGCIYINKIAEVDAKVFKQLIEAAGGKGLGL